MQNYQVAEVGLSRNNGAVRTAPADATVIPLGLPPLHMKIEAGAQAGIKRLNCKKSRNPDLYGLGMQTSLT
jgi:hypothetical protein